MPTHSSTCQTCRQSYAKPTQSITKETSGQEMSQHWRSLRRLSRRESLFALRSAYAADESMGKLIFEVGCTLARACEPFGESSLRPTACNNGGVELRTSSSSHRGIECVYRAVNRNFEVQQGERTCAETGFVPTNPRPDYYTTSLCLLPSLRLPRRTSKRSWRTMPCAVLTSITRF